MSEIPRIDLPPRYGVNWSAIILLVVAIVVGVVLLWGLKDSRESECNKLRALAERGNEAAQVELAKRAC